MKAKNVKQVLEAARWILENVGWGTMYYGQTQMGMPLAMGQVHCDTKCACATGAIWMVEAKEELKNQAEDLLKEEVGTHVPFWNDARGRTKEEVIDVFTRVINKL